MLTGNSASALGVERRMARIALALVVAALVAPPGASAKELLQATVCGASGCRTVKDKGTLNEIPGGETATALGAPAPYYRLVLVGAEPGGRRYGFSLYYVPSANAVAWKEERLVRLHPIYGARANGVMRRLTAGLEPYPAPRLSAALVGSRRITGAAAQSYLSLFTLGEDAPRDVSSGDWIPIDLRSTRPSPWTEGPSEFVFSPSERLLEIAWEHRRIPDAIAADIAAGRPLHEEQSRGIPWAWIGLGAIGLAAVILVPRKRMLFKADTHSP